MNEASPGGRQNCRFHGPRIGLFLAGVGGEFFGLDTVAGVANIVTVDESNI